MTRPLIGITTGLVENYFGFTKEDHVLGTPYFDALYNAGALPVALPFAKDESEATENLKGLNGILFSGGADLHPIFYGQKVGRYTWPAPLKKCVSDMSYMRSALRGSKPILGICLGMQELNVALGGTLVQHIYGHAGGREMRVKTLHGRIKNLVGEKPYVNHFHHQCVGEVGRDLVVAARCGDGVVESVVMPGKRFVVGVQWHPERLQDYPGQRSIFESFVEEASK